MWIWAVRNIISELRCRFGFEYCVNFLGTSFQQLESRVHIKQISSFGWLGTADSLGQVGDWNPITLFFILLSYQFMVLTDLKLQNLQLQVGQKIKVKQAKRRHPYLVLFHLTGKTNKWATIKQAVHLRLNKIEAEVSISVLFHRILHK